MSLTSNTFANINSIEFGKFTELTNDSRFPAMSANRVYYRDNGSPLSATDIYKKYASLVYVVNEGQPTASNWDIAVVSAGVGSFTAFSSQNAIGATVYNNSGVSVSLKRTGGTNSISIANGSTLQVPISGNLNEISIQSSSGTVNVHCLYTI